MPLCVLNTHNTAPLKLFCFLFLCACCCFAAPGSACLFSALLKKCVKRNVFALCRSVFRRNYPPRFVALVPQMEAVDEGKVQITPPGKQLLGLSCLLWLLVILASQEAKKLNLDQEVEVINGVSVAASVHMKVCFFFPRWIYVDLLSAPFIRFQCHLPAVCWRPANSRSS